MSDEILRDSPWRPCLDWPDADIGKVQLALRTLVADTAGAIPADMLTPPTLNLLSHHMNRCDTFGHPTSDIMVFVALDGTLLTDVHMTRQHAWFTCAAPAPPPNKGRGRKPFKGYNLPPQSGFHGIHSAIPNWRRHPGISQRAVQAFRVPARQLLASIAGVVIIGPPKDDRYNVTWSEESPILVGSMNTVATARPGSVLFMRQVNPAEPHGYMRSFLCMRGMSIARDELGEGTEFDEVISVLNIGKDGCFSGSRGGLSAGRMYDICRTRVGSGGLLDHPATMLEGHPFALCLLLKDGMPHTKDIKVDDLTMNTERRALVKTDRAKVEFHNKTSLHAFSNDLIRQREYLLSAQAAAKRAVKRGLPAETAARTTPYCTECGRPWGDSGHDRYCTTITCDTEGCDSPVYMTCCSLPLCKSCWHTHHLSAGHPVRLIKTEVPNG